ncbi:MULTISPECIES: TrbI/VirB10 family protein [unclassified Luteimonas]
MNENTPNSQAGSHDAAANPYYARQSGAPDLDAGAPVLRSADVQRLNRKALVFLVGIVALLMVAAFWLLGGFGASDQGARQGAEERVVIPDAPNDMPLPPLPPEIYPDPVMPLPLAQAPAPAPSIPLPQNLASGFSGPSLLERRMQNGGGFGAGGGSDSVDDYASRMDAIASQADAFQAQGQTGNGFGGDASVRPLYRPDSLMVRGTLIRCVLETRVVTDVPGFTSCIVTEPVYSINGRRMLLPKGAKVLGTYGSDAIGGNRVAVVWDRITTPNGLDINMSSPGVDNLGSAGHPGHYDAHWPQRISSALLISLLSDAFKYAGAKHGPQQVDITNGTVVQSPYESNTARTMERLANLALDKSMSRPATVTINQGEVVNVYVAQDVDFSSVLL